MKSMKSHNDFLAELKNMFATFHGGEEKYAALEAKLKLREDEILDIAQFRERLHFGYGSLEPWDCYDILIKGKNGNRIRYIIHPYLELK